MGSLLTVTLNGQADAGWNVTVVRHEAEVPDPAIQGLAEPDLIAAVLDGRPGAFDLIVERHRRPVYQICYRFMGNHEDASDLSQDVFLRAYRGLKNFKGNAALGTWLHRIAVNTCLNRVAVKTPKSEPLEETQHVDTTSETPTERLLRDERAVRVRAAVAKLPAKQRAALILRTYREKSHQEIADTLGTSVGAAKANVFHALQNLKKLLGEL
ncbi:MAG: sigma-70 family RNA polymerase sigma factor [Vicinamibacterales bacterium]